MERLRDDKGRFISATAAALLKQSQELSAKADELIEAENNPPEWLKELIVAMARAIGITADELSDRAKIIHPTPADPVLTIDGKPIISWV